MEEIQTTAFQWLDELLSFNASETLRSFPRLLRWVLPLLSHDSCSLSNAASRVNKTLTNLLTLQPSAHLKGINQKKRKPQSTRNYTADIAEASGDEDLDGGKWGSPCGKKSVIDISESIKIAISQLDFSSEQTKVAAVEWLLLLHRQCSFAVSA